MGRRLISGAFLVRNPGHKPLAMETLRETLRRGIRQELLRAVGRMHPSLSVISCVGILVSYLTGIYVTGSLHQPSRWLGAMLACTSVVVVLQSPNYRESLRTGWRRILGTFLGVVIAYVYLRIWPFTIAGMLLTVFVLEMLCMLLGIYKNDRIATITLLIVLLVSQMTPRMPPAENCLLRFCESAVGVGVGVALIWLLDRWNRWRHNRPVAAQTAPDTTPGAAPDAGKGAGKGAGKDAGKDAAANTTADMPADTLAETSAESPANIRADTPAETSAKYPADIRADTPSESPADISAEMPADIPANGRADTAAETPFGTSATIHAGSPADTPANTSASGPADTPADTPAGGPADTPADTSAGGPAKRWDMDTMPLRWGHFRVLIVASLGQVTGAGLATLVGIILPMIQLVRHPVLSSAAQGAIACTSLVGIMIGSIWIGAWSDRRGYLFFFRACPLLILAASLAAWAADSLAVLVPALLLMGIGIGGGYSLDSDYISEIMPRRWRLVMVGVAKAASSLGNIAVAVVCFFLLRGWEDPHRWNRLLGIVSGLAAVMFLCRIRFGQSPGWLIARGRIAEAERAVHRFLGPDVDVGEIRDRPSRERTQAVSWRSLLRKGNRTKAIFSGIPWACEGVGVYGIGVFLPVLLLALEPEPAQAAGFAHITRSVALTAWINLFILPGFVAGLLLVNRWYHVRTQTWGFVLSAAGLALLLAAYRLHGATWIALAGFILFEFFLNAGPHLMTFILPPQIYSVAERGAGTGLAAACGKLGAVAGVLFVPMLLAWGGMELVLLATVGVLLAGAAVTFFAGRRVLPDRGRSYRPEIRHSDRS